MGILNNNAVGARTAPGFWPVFAALLGNFTIMILKFIGYVASGSAVMFSEGIHSLADTLNQALLMIGIRRSVRAADPEFSYGYGHERFIWALISACGIFFVGAGVTIYKGVAALLTQTEIEKKIQREVPGVRHIDIEIN
jgi:zinc transporter 9